MQLFRRLTVSKICLSRQRLGKSVNLSVFYGYSHINGIVFYADKALIKNNTAILWGIYRAMEGFQEVVGYQVFIKVEDLHVVLDKRKETQAGRP